MSIIFLYNDFLISHICEYFVLKFKFLKILIFKFIIFVYNHIFCIWLKFKSFKISDKYKALISKYKTLKNKSKKKEYLNMRKKYCR